MSSWTDYIMRSDRRVFRKVAARDPGHNYDHLMVMGCLCGDSPRDNLCYLGRRTRLPLRLSVCQTRTRADKIFAELRRAVPKLNKQAEHKNS